MPRQTRGERYSRNQRAVHDAKILPGKNAAQALRDYRKGGGRVRTQDWYAMWRGESVRPPEEPQQKPEVRIPGRYITNVGVVWYDPKDGATRTFWHPIYTPKGRGERMTDDEAMSIAIDEDQDTADRYGLVLAAAYVTSYEG